MQLILRTGKTRRIGQAHRQKDHKPCAKDQEFRHDQHPDHQITGQIVERARGVGHAPTR